MKRTNGAFTMKKIIFAIMMLAAATGCGLPPVCKGEAPKEYELVWSDYNSVGAFLRYFSGYETTIMQHIGDTIKLYGYLPSSVYQIEGQEYFDGGRGFDLFDSAEGGNVVHVSSSGDLSIPSSFISTKIYVIGIFDYDKAMGCNYGSDIRLVSLDTMPSK